MNRHQASVGPAPQLLTLVEAATQLRISRWMLYRLIRSGQLATVQFGRRRLVAAAAIEELIDRAQEAS